MIGLVSEPNSFLFFAGSFWGVKLNNQQSGSNLRFIPDSNFPGAFKEENGELNFALESFRKEKPKL